MVEIVTQQADPGGILEPNPTPGFNPVVTNTAGNAVLNLGLGKDREPCLPHKPNTRDIKRTSTTNFILPPDWTTLDITDPYFDAVQNKYFISVPTPFDKPPPDGLEVLFNEAKPVGAAGLLNVYGKEITDQNIQKIVSKCETIDWFVPERPNPLCGENGEVVPLFGIKVHISIVAEVLDNISPAQNNHTGEILPLASKEITLVSNELKKKIKNVGDIIRNFAVEATTKQGKPLNINLEKEAKRLEDFISILQNLLIANGFSLREDQADLIIIGLDDKLNILYVLYDNGNDFLRLFAGFDNFIQTKPAQNDRTLLFLSQLGQIEKLGHKSTTTSLVDFIGDFVARPPPFSFDFGAPSPLAFSAAKTLPDIIADANSKSVKTEEEKQKEDELLASSNFKHAMTKNLKNTDFVGDSTLDIQNFAKTLESLNSLEDLYDNILNKISLQNIVLFALKCLPIPDPCVLAKAFLVNLGCEEFIATYEKFAGPIIRIPFLQTEIRNGIKDCLNTMSEEERIFLLGRIQFKAGFPVPNVDVTDLVALDILFEAVGAKGQKILKSLCDDPRVKKQIMDAIPIDICELFEITLPDIPIPLVIDFPDILPTIDIMAEIVLRLEAAILDALVSTLLNMIKNIIIGVLENCGDLSKLNFGLININDILAQSLDLNVQALKGVTDQFLNGMNLSTDKIALLGKDISGLFDDCSSLLSPSEIANLLNGDATDDVIKIVKCVINKKYPNLIPILDTPVKIEDMFSNFGALVDKQLLFNQITQQSEVLQNNPDICDTPDNDGRKKLLQDKGLTPEQIDYQVANNNKRKNDRLKNLLNLLHKRNPLDGVLPPLFCQGKETQQKGLVERDHPSFRYMLDKTIDTIYDGVHISFNQEIASLPVVLKETNSPISKGRIVKKTINYNGTNIPNPEFQRLVAQGTPVGEDQEEITVYENINIVSNDVAKGLKESLANFEFNNTLFSFDKHTGKIIFTIRNGLEPDVLSAPFNNAVGNVLDIARRVASGEEFQTASDNKDDITHNVSSNIFSNIQNQIDNLKHIENRIEYVLPNNPTSNKDEYNISIIEKTNIQNQILSENKTFDISKSNDIPNDILSIIHKNGLEVLPNTSLPQSYFSSFVSKICMGGSNIYGPSGEISKPEYGKGIGQPTNINTINNELRNKVKTDIYSNIFVDLFSSFASQVAKSPLFNIKVLSLVNFTPDKQDGCSPHLLDIEDLKNGMKEDFDNNKCNDDFTPSTDGLGKDSLNTLEQAGVSSVVITFIRLITIEQIIKSIFVFSEFKLADIGKLDDITVSFIIKNIKNEINMLGQKQNDIHFNDEFKEQVLKTYNNKVKNNKINGSETDDENIALEVLIKEQIKSVISRISTIIGTQGNVSLDKILIEEWLPLFEVGNGSLRLAQGTQGNLTNIKSHINSSERKDYETIFNLENGNLILERYIRISDKHNTNFSVVQVNRRGDGLFGVANVQDFNNFISSLKQIETQNGNKIKFSEDFDNISYGLRLSYVSPVSNNSFNITDPNVIDAFISSDTSIVPGLFSSDNGKIKDASKLDKSFRVFEGMNVGIDGRYIDITQPKTSRELNIFPLVSVEISENDLKNISTDTNIINKWEQKSGQLREMLMNTKEFKFLFDFCFPLNRMMSLIILYNITYLSNIKKLQTLFDGTKFNLKTVFQTLLNSGNYSYDDKGVASVGGNAGLNTSAQNNVADSGIVAMAARTGWLILKGLVEKVDPAISKGKQIKDAAAFVGKDIEMWKAVLSTLPCNIFPPPPIGPGIGPPITPLGFIYLAQDLESMFKDAQNINAKQGSIKQDFNIDLSNIPCKDS